ncbi:MAG TPA: 3-dehydroquinate synthase [Polyangiaceae bacterium]|nr:3-dehydroquinate synthase [Polyangiaceae bacterium]
MVEPPMMERPLLLGGFMATGKSTVGKLVAERCGRAYVDLDGEIERSTGKTVAALFAERGETAFRTLERQELQRVLDAGGPVVVSLGGGALVDRGARLDALERGVVVTLEASADEIVRRAGDTASRPLLQGGDARARVDELLAVRKLGYAESHARITTTGRSPDDVARDAIAVWQRDPIAVAAGADTYTVEVGTDIAVERLPSLLRGASLGLLVTDRTVLGLHGDGVENAMEQSGVRVATVVLDPGEEHKNTAALERIWSAALVAGADRKSLFVALGGGVVSDVAGFGAATWMRGVSWLCLPTTLLSMVDASVGGKTAIDLKTAKNAVGAFWQPSSVLCDVRHLTTEPGPGFVSGLAEVVKTALIGDAPLLDFVDTHAAAILAKDLDVVSEVVKRSVRVKARVVSLDPREENIRAWLNLGHTVGHAIEAYGGYGKLRHGEAISLGLVAALRIGERLGITEQALSERTIATLHKLGLPVDLAAQPIARAVDLIGHDKKRAGSRLKFIAARSAGKVEIVDLDVQDLRSRVLELVG